MIAHPDAAAAVLLERDAELARAGALRERAAGGEGTLLVLEGAAGSGKTALLDAICARGRDDALTVLTGRGSELERAFAFGLVRQALEPELARVGEDERDRLLGGPAAPARAALGPAGAEDGQRHPYDVLNGVFWLVAALAERNPLLLALDDVHWADEPSLRFLAFAATRVASLPLLLVVSCRPRAGEATDDLVAAIASAGGAQVLRMRTLGREAVRAIVARRLDGTPDEAFTAACEAASGGNPFLLAELLRELAAAGVSPAARNAARVGEISPENVARSVDARLRRVGAPGAAVARALATLGDGSPLALVARVGGMTDEDARAGADALATAGLLASAPPPRFAHPLLRNAVASLLTVGERLALHERAAALLREAGAPPERVALHLLELEPGGDPATATVLAAAGHEALARGAPETAARLLARALAEPPAATGRFGVLLDLGIAEREQGRASARAHLLAAIDAAPDPRARARAAHALFTGPDNELMREQIPVYERAAADVRATDRELSLALEARRLEGLLLLPDHVPRFEDETERFRDLPGDTPAECALLCFCGRKAMLEGGDAAAVAALVARAARNLDLSQLGAHSIWLVTTILWLPVGTGLVERIDRRLTEAIAAAAERGSASVFAWSSTMRALVRTVTGDLRSAEADARAALDSGGLAGIFPHAPLTGLTEILGEAGRAAEAEALLRERGLGGALPMIRPYTALLISRGRMRAAAGDLPAARADLEEALDRLASSRSGGVVGLDARLELALVLHGLGDGDAARRLAGDALATARAWGAERAVGGALRVAGVLRGGEQGIAMLEEAVAVLATSDARLWHAHALVDHGAALRRANRRRESRPPLREGIELAGRCGAAALERRGRHELAAAGGRAPRRAAGDRSELTPSELRIAELAAGGLSNPEIAQRLFLSIKTVEMHLSAAYRELGIGSRHELAAALRASGRATASR